MQKPDKIYTVSEINREIEQVLKEIYSDIWIEGEISNFSMYSSGHMYFSLKDESSQLRAVFFQGANRFLKFSLENGLKVIARGCVTVYSKRGEYQLIVNSMEPAGLGALQLAFEQLKEKLEKEGLFSRERKKPIPSLPRKIGIITSPTGAAIRDMLCVLKRRFSNLEIMIYPVRVQGDEAKHDIVEALNYLNKNQQQLDVILLGRGGGSIEDLWPFNEEIVARAISSSKIPIISCVGHETDFTIADFVSDLRAPTPSAAAELVIKSKSELAQKVGALKFGLISKMKSLLLNYEYRLRPFSTSRALTEPVRFFADKIQQVDELFLDLSDAVNRSLKTREDISARLFEKLNVLSPLQTLARGYSICWRHSDNSILKDSNSISNEDEIKVKLSKGGLTAKVTSTSKE